MEQLFAERFLGIPWIVLMLVALGVAGAFLVVDLSGGASGLRWFVLRWFHSHCWLFLALGALAMTRLTPLPVEWAGPLGATGGVVYLVLLVFTLSGPR